MATYIKSVTFDCADARVVGHFWAAALGGELEEDSTAEKAFMEPPGWGGPALWFACPRATSSVSNPRPSRKG